MISDFLADLRYAARSLRQSPGFTLIAVLTLALGVGANTAVFSLINSVLLRPLPYAEPDRLVLVWESAPFFGLRDSPVAPGNYLDWRVRSRSFSEMGAIESRSYRLVGGGMPEVLQGSLTTPGVFRTLGIRPQLGRIFREDEDRPGAPKVAIISHALWQRRLGGDPAILGRTITLNDSKHTIVGVLAPGTEVPTEYGEGIDEVWTPFGTAYSAEGLTERGRHNFMVIARLRPGVTLGQADQEMKAIGAALAGEYPKTNAKVGAFVAPLRDHFVTSSRPMLLVLLATVVFVLLIACSNLANLLLSRAASRGKEVAVRSALGASSFDLLRRSLAESLLLCALGSVLGVALATASFRSLAHLAPGTVTGMKSLSLDWRVLGYTLAVALATAILFGLVPLVQLRRFNLNLCLKQSARTLAGAGPVRLRAVLIASEVALAFILLMGAGLLLRTFSSLRNVDFGCQTRNILTLRMPPSARHRGPLQSAAYQREVLRGVTAIPGVVSAGFTNHIPLLVKGDVSGMAAEGRDPAERFQANARTVSPNYMRTMGIPLRRGRTIEERDIDGAPYVVVINETLARNLWPNQDPIGRRVMFGDNTWVPVVGVVGDIHQGGLDVAPKPEFYIACAQAGFPPTSLAIRTRVDPNSVAGAVRRAIWAADPDQPITDMATMEEIVDRELFQRRVQTTLVGTFGGLALLLAAIGLYGVLAYLVGRQTPEIGVRMALGATPADILGGVVGRGLRVTLAGLAVGAVGGLAVSRLLSSLLFGVNATDPATYAGATLLLVATAALASYLPARRAMRVDPVVALRDE